jgi:ubiquinone/menaquinone biosynthesis C-methylase UbiE
MSAVTQTNPAPFDRIANVYDDIFSNSRIGLVQRKAVWAELDRNFRPGESILEINCGTGVDAFIWRAVECMSMLVTPLQK